MTFIETLIQSEVKRINAAYRDGEITNDQRHAMIRNTLERLT